MSITFEAAIQELQTMFPEWDQETLETLLQANGNHVERTIESILAMEGATDVISHSQAAPSQTYQPQQSSQPYQPQPSFGYDQRGGLNGYAGQPPGARPSEFYDSHQEGEQRRAPGVTYRGIRANLPDDFLRVPGYKNKEDTVMGDEQLAILLQNELFAREVEQALGPNWQQRYYQNPSGQQPQYQQGGMPPLQQSSSQSGIQQTPSNDGDLGIMKKLSSVTSNAKESLRNLAISFQKRKQAGNFSRMNDPPGQSETSRLVGNDHADGDDDEVITFEGVNPAHRGRHVLDDTGSGGRSPSSASTSRKKNI